MTTTFNAESIAAASKTAATEMSALASTAFAGFEKLAEVNMAAAKSAFTESMESFQTVLSAKTPQEVLAAQAALVKPLAEKAAAYGRTVYGIATETSAELSKASEGKLAEAQKSFGAAIDNMAKNAPAGSETIVAAYKSAIATGQQVMDSAKAAAKNAAAQTEANVAKVTDLAVKAAKTVSKK